MVPLPILENRRKEICKVYFEEIKNVNHKLHYGFRVCGDAGERVGWQIFPSRRLYAVSDPADRDASHYSCSAA